MIFMCSCVRQSVSETNLNYRTLTCYDSCSFFKMIMISHGPICSRRWQVLGISWWTRSHSLYLLPRSSILIRSMRFQPIHLYLTRVSHLFHRSVMISFFLEPFESWLFIIRQWLFQPWRFRIWTLSLINWRDIRSSFLSNIARVVLISVLLSVKRYQQTSTIDVASAQRSFPGPIFFMQVSQWKSRKLDLGFWCLFICFCQ